MLESVVNGIIGSEFRLASIPLLVFFNKMHVTIQERSTEIRLEIQLAIILGLLLLGQTKYLLVRTKQAILVLEGRYFDVLSVLGYLILRVEFAPLIPGATNVSICIGHFGAVHQGEFLMIYGIILSSLKIRIMQRELLLLWLPHSNSIWHIPRQILHQILVTLHICNDIIRAGILLNHVILRAVSAVIPDVWIHFVIL